MLYLTRKPGESILINNNVKLTVIDIKGKSVRLGFLFSPEVRVLREEIFLRIQQEDQEAAEAGKYIQELEELEVAKRMKKLQHASESKDSEEEVSFQKKSSGLMGG
ncbi:MAG: carbon storage regulator [Alphaproteobacteria bacterium]